MTPRSLLVALFAIGALASTSSGVGCAPSAEADGDRICTPGANVFCRCRDRSQGTKTCNPDGRSFEACGCESFGNPEVGGDDEYTPARPPPAVLPDSGSPIGPTRCGDGAVQDGEDCDDGNAVDVDGCDSKCRLAGTNPVASRSCPGLPVHVWSMPVTYAGTTIGSTNTASSEPACPSSEGSRATSGAAAADRVFAVTAHRRGTMTVTTSDAAFDNYVYVARACLAGANAVFACSNKAQGHGGEAVSFPVEANETYTVFVDGVLTSTGPFRVTFEIR